MVERKMIFLQFSGNRLITCEIDTDSIVEKYNSDLNADRKAIAFMSI